MQYLEQITGRFMEIYPLLPERGDFKIEPCYAGHVERHDDASIISFSFSDQSDLHFQVARREEGPLVTGLMTDIGGLEHVRENITLLDGHLVYRKDTPIADGNIMAGWQVDTGLLDWLWLMQVKPFLVSICYAADRGWDAAYFSVMDPDGKMTQFPDNLTGRTRLAGAPIDWQMNDLDARVNQILATIDFRGLVDSISHTGCQPVYNIEANLELKA